MKSVRAAGRFSATPISDRFWANVDKELDAGNGPGCWYWLGSVNAGGYGQISVGKKKHMVHRVALELAGQTLQDWMEVDHLCRNTRCVRPDHLEQVTPRVNTLRSGSVSASNARKTHCPKGHPYSDENTMRTRDGYRRCRVCSREQTEAWAERNPEATLERYRRRHLRSHIAIPPRGEEGKNDG